MSNPHDLSADEILALMADAPMEDMLKALSGMTGKQPGEPSDDVKRSLAVLYKNSASRHVIDWLFTITVRAPMPTTPQTMDAMAMAAARHAERQSIGHAISRAILAGNELLNQPKVSHENDA